MVGPAQWDCIFIADTPPEGARLGEPQMVGVRGPSAANQARLGRHEPEVRTIAVSARFAECEGALVDLPCHRIVDPSRGPQLLRQIFRGCCHPDPNRRCIRSTPVIDGRRQKSAAANAASTTRLSSVARVLLAAMTL
jgi:hypothetical protein